MVVARLRVSTTRLVIVVARSMASEAAGASKREAGDIQRDDSMAGVRSRIFLLRLRLGEGQRPASGGDWWTVQLVAEHRWAGGGGG